MRGKTSDNALIKQQIGWRPSRLLHEGLEKTFARVAEQVEVRREDTRLSLNEELVMVTTSRSWNRSQAKNARHLRLLSFAMSNAQSWLIPPAQPLLEGARVHVWLWDLEADISTRDQDLLTSLLSAEERVRMSRFRFLEDRNRFLISHATLRRLLGNYLKCAPCDVSFVYSSEGKPNLAPGCEILHFNLSHTEQIAVAAFTRGFPLGIDIEHRSRRLHPDLGRHVFAPEENERLMRLPIEQRTDAFFLCWTRKEAICKAEGYGLSEATSQFSVSLEQGEPPCIKSMGGVLTRAWFLLDLPSWGDLVGALAIAESTSTIDYFIYPA